MIFFGGMLQIIGAVMEWVLGNTFSMCLFFTYGTFWIVAGTQNIPNFGTGIQYAQPLLSPPLAPTNSKPMPWAKRRLATSLLLASITSH